jgi:hypothetical protein
MSMRNGGPHSLTPRRAAVGPGHVGFGPGLVDENRAVGIQIGLALKPRPASFQDVRAVLFRGVGRLFCA